MKKIAVLIPVFNKLEYTQKCIKYLDELTGKGGFRNIEVSLVVIDDGSTDGTGHWINKEFPSVTVLKGDGSLWWSGGVKLGAKWATEEENMDYILLWNNDIVVEDDYFKELDKLIPELKEDVIAGSKIYVLHKPDIVWSYGGIFNSRTGASRMIGYFKPDSEEYQKPLESDWLTGMGTLVHKSVFESVGYWDAELFPQYMGDSDFTLRARAAGFKIVSYPQLRMWNDVTNSGIRKKSSFSDIVKLLKDNRSQFQVRRNLAYYKRHSRSFLAYGNLFFKYLGFFGGFFKWKLLSLFGINKNPV